MPFLGFLFSKAGMYIMLAIAVAAVVGIFTYKVHHHGYVEGVAEWKPKFLALNDENIANNALNTRALEGAKSDFDQALKQEKARYDAELKKLPKVVVKREVVHELELAVDGVCTITNGFVWLRDEPFVPEYAARLGLPAEAAAPAGAGQNAVPPVADAWRTVDNPYAYDNPYTDESSQPAGISASEVAAQDGAALGVAKNVIEVLERNLALWDAWYEDNKPIFDKFNAKLRSIAPAKIN